jgi:3-hydroxyacyl-CoA dehydrogenase
MFLVGTDQMEAGKYISEHDKKINKLAYVLVVIYLNLHW